MNADSIVTDEKADLSSIKKKMLFSSAAYFKDHFLPSTFPLFHVQLDHRFGGGVEDRTDH